MTLQQIADYAMEYLDGKGVAAEYIINSDNVRVSFNVVTLSGVSFKVSIAFDENEYKAGIAEWLGRMLNA